MNDEERGCLGKPDPTPGPLDELLPDFGSSLASCCETADDDTSSESAAAATEPCSATARRKRRRSRLRIHTC